MNERIKQLLDKCIEPGFDKPWPLVNHEKFAEMIVRECADVAANHEALDIYEEILDHFGM